MNPSVPMSQFVNVIPGVLQAGAADLAMNAVFLDNTGDTSVPVGTLKQFGSAADVAAWYGANSVEASLAEVYFSGFNNATQIPSALYFAQYNTAAVAGYLRGGALSGVSLTALQALSGTITVVIDGVSHVSAAINLSSATSFSNAAALIQAGLDAGTPSTTATCTYDSLRNAFVITSSTTGASSTLAFPTTNSFTTGLNLTAAAGAVLSPGAIAAVPATLMTTITGLSTDWATFMTVQDPDSGAAGGTIKQAFSTWNAGQNAQYLYVAYDTDAAAAAGADPNCYAQKVAALTGTLPVWDSNATQAALVAAFACGYVAAINFESPGGRTTLAARSSPVLVPDITSLAVYLSVKGNGYNAYIDVATRTTQFQWMQPGSVTGAWDWADSYVNQIFWNARFQNDFAELLNQVPAIPYNQNGYNMVRESISQDIQEMGAFGAWVAGVELSGDQIIAINTAAGLSIANTIQNQGWYLQVADPGPTVRSQRGTPIVKFWYSDGQSIQTIDMSSVDVE